MRLEWVHFLAKVNEQCFKESSWRDISICCEHFERESFEELSHSSAKLKPNAVPSLWFHSEESEPSDGGNLEVSRAHDRHMQPSLYFINETSNIL